MEFQEWFRLRALPAMQNCADRNFMRKPGFPEHWFSTAEASSYARLVHATQFQSMYHKKYLISHDQDSRHSMKHYPPTRAGRRGKPIDRRSLPNRSPLRISVDVLKDYVPTAPRVPDCIQSPIEMFFAPVKTRFRALLEEHRRQGCTSNFDVVMQKALQAFKENGTADRGTRCWRHAIEKSLRIFATPAGEWLKIGEADVMGTGGDWVPKKYRG